MKLIPINDIYVYEMELLMDKRENCAKRNERWGVRSFKE